MAIKLYVDEQTIELKTDKNIASDTIDFVELIFTFCDSWEGYTKTVQFTQRTNTYNVYLGVNDTRCFLPSEITDGLCSISVFGNKEDTKRATTIPLNIRVKRSGFIEDALNPEKATPSIIEQLTAAVGNAEAIAGNAETIAEKLQDKVSVLEEKTDIWSTSNPNRCAESFKKQFSGKGYHDQDFDITYNSETNELTINGSTDHEVEINSFMDLNSLVPLQMGLYEFVDCSTNVYMSRGNLKPLPFKLGINVAAKRNFTLSKHYIMTDIEAAKKETTLQQSYNIVDRDSLVTMFLIIPAGSTFENKVFHPYLIRYSSYVNNDLT